MCRGTGEEGNPTTHVRWSVCTPSQGWHPVQRLAAPALPQLAAWGRRAEDEPTQPVFTEPGHTHPFESFERFVRQHERALLNYLWRLLGEEQPSYDLTQETFVRAWQQFEKISRYE